MRNNIQLGKTILVYLFQFKVFRVQASHFLGGLDYFLLLKTNHQRYRNIIQCITKKKKKLSRFPSDIQHFQKTMSESHNTATAVNSMRHQLQWKNTFVNVLLQLMLARGILCWKLWLQVHQKSSETIRMRVFLKKILFLIPAKK